MGEKKIAKMAKQVTYELDREQLFRPVRSQWVNPVPEYLRELPNATSPVEKEAYENLGKVTSDPLIGANSVSRVYYKINPAALSTSSKVFAQKNSSCRSEIRKCCSSLGCCWSNWSRLRRQGNQMERLIIIFENK